MKVFYLKGLNGLRAIAAIAVLISHIMLSLGIGSLDLAGFGVTIFFALSGFLITALLLKEQDKTGNISIKKFYVRRILRIWPLYYLYILLVIICSYVFFKDLYSFKQILPYLFFVPNIPFVLGGMIGMLGHYWSLGVEEQFYLFWPYVVKKFQGKFVRFNVLFILAFLIIKVILNRYYGGYSVPYTLIYVTRFDCMAIGGLGAYLYHYKKLVIRYLHLNFVEGFAWFVIALVFFNKFHTLSIIDHEIVGIITVVLIINQISNPKSLINLENKILDYLGKISFGLYVYHPLIIGLNLYFLNQLGYTPKNGIPALTFITATIIFSFLTAHLSYKYFESWFLKQKAKFAVIQSAGSAQQLVHINALNKDMFENEKMVANL